MPRSSTGQFTAGSNAWDFRKRTSTLERLLSKVKKTSGCWLWRGAIAPTGYGYFDGSTAHRRAYELLIGSIPENLQLDHLCRNRSCVNPEHLEPVTGAENVLRGEGVAAQNARKAACLRGHIFDTVNTYLTPDGRRQCRICLKIRRGKSCPA